MQTLLHQNQVKIPVPVQPPQMAQLQMTECACSARRVSNMRKWAALSWGSTVLESIKAYNVSSGHVKWIQKEKVKAKPWSGAVEKAMDELGKTPIVYITHTTST